MTTRMSLAGLLGIQHPIIQAPMAGSTTPELVAAVSNAGALGTLGAAYMTPAQIAENVAAIRRLTERPFGVNLFVGGLEPSEGVDREAMRAILARHHTELGLSPPEIPAQASMPFEEQLEAVLDAGVPVFSFTFGIPAARWLKAFKERGSVVIGTATTVDEARQLAEAGVDAVVAQGSEAGAHRGTFAAPFEAAMLGTVALVPQMADAVDVPAIASGGIMDGRGIIAAEALGAAGVQMGTAFLTCRESSISDAYRAAIRAARAEQTTLTRAYSGRPARGIVNDFMRELQGQEEAILPFPLQNYATRPMRNAAAAQDRTGLMSLWAGQGAPLARDIGAGELVAHLVREASEVRARLCH